MRVPLSWLTQHVDINVSPEDLADKLTFAGVEIETVDRVGDDLAGIVTARVLEFDDHSGILVLPPDAPVGADLVEEVGLRDTVLDVKTAPNRGDVLSMRGIAREVALLLGTDLKPLDLTVPETGPPAAGLATGAVVDVTNYLLLDQGQPLHAFDLDRVPGQRILVRRAREGETLRTLDGRDRRLTAADTLITSGEQALALAGIMGGEDSEVRPDTTRVLIESAHFPPATVRRTMRRLGMSTEGGQRWARGVDPAGAEPVCDQAARLMAQLAGGTVAAGRLRG